MILENLANVNLDNDLTAMAYGGRVVDRRQPRPDRDRSAQGDGEGWRDCRDGAVEYDA